MRKSVLTLAIAMIIYATAYGTSHAMPIAPLTGKQTQSNDVTQVYWHRHWGWHRHYWGWHRPYYWGWRRRWWW
jgi:hypothetical protein